MKPLRDNIPEDPSSYWVFHPYFFIEGINFFYSFTDWANFFTQSLQLYVES